MNTNVRRSRRIAVVLVLCLVVSAWLGPPASVHGAQAVQAPDLDGALRSGDLAKARRLVPVNWAASEALFVSYLERAFITPDAVSTRPDARTLAGRWAEVHFVIVEYDFARAVLSTLDTADTSKRQQLVAAVRDYFSALERVRATTVVQYAPTGAPPPPAVSQQRTAERKLIASQLLEVAGRFLALSFPRGQLWALRSTINLPGTTQPPQPSAGQMADKVADQLGDPLSLVAKRPFTDASLAAAERLGLVHRQLAMLDEMGRNLAGSKETARLEQSAKYLERARVLSRSIPPVETINNWLFPSAAPRSAIAVLPELWRVYQTVKRPADAQPLVAEALEISRPFGERAQTATILAFASRTSGLDRDTAASIIQASQALGPRPELAVLRQMSGSGGALRPDLAEKALALAVAIPDPHERAVTLESYSRQALLAIKVALSKSLPGSDALAGFSRPVYRQLRELCLASDELDLTADALASEGEAYATVGDSPAADDSNRKAIALAERAGNWLKVAQIANRAIIAPTGRPSNAARAEFARTAVEAAKKADSAEELARALRASAQTVEEMEQAVAAAARYTQQSGDSKEEFSSLDRLAAFLYGRGEYQAAIDAYRRIVARSPDKGGLVVNSPKLHAYQQVLRIYSTIGEPSLARDAADHIRELLESSVLGADRPPPAQDIGRAYERLGNAAAALGEPVAAVDEWDKALKKLAEAGTDNGVQLSRRSILEARGTLYALVGDYEASEADWQQVPPLIPPTLRNYYGFSATGHMVSWRTALAWTHALAGNLDKALALAREAIAELKDDTSGLWAGLWYDGQSAEERLLGILLATNHADEMIPVLEGLLRPVLISPSREELLLRLLARTYAAIKQPDKARALLVSAMDINRRPPAGQANPAESLLALGALEFEAGNIPEAKQRLLEARGAVKSYDVERVWQIERGLARALAREGDGAGAEAHYEQALSALDSVRERPRPEESTLRYGFDPARVYEEYAGLIAARAVLSGREADAERAFHAAERKRAQTLRNLLATGWSRMPAAAMPDQVRRSREMDARLTAKLGILRAQFDEPSEKLDRVLVEKLKADVEQIQASHARLLASIAQGQYRYAAPTSLAAPRAAAVRAALEPSVALVEYLVLDDRSYAFVLTRAGVKAIPLAIGRESLRKQVGGLLLPFRQLRTGRVDLSRLDFDARASHTLYQAIFAPVQPHIGSASELVIVPDDVLNILPFETLVERAPRAAALGRVVHAELVDQAFLLRRYAVSYLASSAQLVSGAASPGPDGGTPKRFFAMANPAAGRVQPEPAQDDPLKRQLRSAGFDAYLAPLPGTEAEVARIARYFPEGSSTVVTGGLATEAAYRSRAGEASVIHFATHAVASDSQPLYSTLVLAPDAKVGEDGFLQAYEVLRTPLRAELVVLSGCETAVGSEDWGQGLVGLAAAFDQAGARSVLATLWSIDESTSDVMADFYRAMAQGRSAPAALRQAKLQLLQRRMPLGNVEISLAHPFFWAPFKLMGVPPK
jgi:CHAT domain-containing protein